MLVTSRMDSNLPRTFLWSLERGERVLTLPGRPHPTAFSPDGAHLAAFNTGGHLEVFHLEEIRAELEALGLGW